MRIITSKTFLATAFFGALLFVVSCSKKADTASRSLLQLSGVSPSIAVSNIPPVDIGSTDLRLRYKPTIEVTAVEDNRDDRILIVLPSKRIALQGDPSISVRYLLERAFRKRGFALQKDAPVSLEVSIRRWRAQLNQSTISSEAILRVDLYGPGGEGLFSALFEGYSQKDSPQLLEKDLQLTLATAMHQALSQLVQNPTLLDYLTAF